jgi:uncharacterized protein (DUF2252 family)
MHDDLFAFYRGTCHLFYEDWPRHSPLDAAPAAWACGDPHPENFGAYKGEERRVHFDLNDFDEAALAPCTRDLARLLAGILVAAQAQGTGRSTGRALARRALDRYVAALAAGHIGWVERDGAHGIVKRLMKKRQALHRRDILDKYAPRRSGEGRRRIRGEDTSRIGKTRRDQIKMALANWAMGQPRRRSYRLLDVADLVVGVGGLGVPRYLLLCGRGRFAQSKPPTPVKGGATAGHRSLGCRPPAGLAPPG